VRGEVEEQVVLVDDAPGARSRRINMALAGLLTCVMLTTFVHPYLFRRDEPREAEIARETLVDNHWITPHLCGLPFLEKPPLYYDLVAAAFAVTGSITPSVARSVSIAFGAITIVTVLIFGFRWGGARRGWLAALILIGMPEFFKYNHLIVLDIAVAAFVTLAMAAFTWWLFWSANAKQRLLACKEKVFVLMRTQILGRLRATSLVSDSWRLRPLPDLDERHRYVLVSNAGD
jgi:4-amino-4-deoxy-L-arabinose transferase-like glycosyltransferase